MIYREETLLNVMRSVTRNGWSIILTAALALILVYLFSIIGYMFFRNDFIVDVTDEVVGWGKVHEHICFFIYFLFCIHFFTGSIFLEDAKAF